MCRGFQVPRRCQPPFAILLLAGALAALLTLAVPSARAQPAGNINDGTSDEGGASLLSPDLNGSPQRFRRPRKGVPDAPSRFGQLPNFDYQPAVGAGTTG